MKKILYLLLIINISCTSDDNGLSNNNLEKEWLYTHIANEATALSNTSISIPVTEDIFAFTDRPNREYKSISGGEFASYWNDYDDENSFKLDPPNAVLTWVGANGVTEVEVVITDADFDGTNLVYTIENTSITANQSFTDVSLFVDANEYYNAVYVGPNNIVMASEGAVNNEQGNIGNEIYTVVDLTTLKFLIDQGDDVSHVVTSLVTDMSELFENNNSFNQDISTWDVSNVTDMSAMFSDATQFNQDIINWDVGNVRNMSEMFQGASSFNQPIGGWDVSSVTDMSAMFSNATEFNQDISTWSISNVDNCLGFSYNSSMITTNIPSFASCNNTNNGIYLDANGITVRASADSVNGDTGIINGITYTVVDSSTFTSMIQNGEDVSKIVTSLITDMSYLFQNNNSFNQDISSWDVSNVTDMHYMFQNATSFNQDISAWPVSNVTDCLSFSDDSSLTAVNLPNFVNCNNNIGVYLDSNGITVRALEGVRNGDVGIVNGVTYTVVEASTFTSMIQNGEDVSKIVTFLITDMSYLFQNNNSFNQDISSWDVSNVTDMHYMFQNATSFNRDISAWPVSNVSDCLSFSDDSSLTAVNLPNFVNCNNNTGVYLDPNGITVRALDGVRNGDVGIINGVTYTVVDASTFSSMIQSGEDVSKIVTSLIVDMSSIFQNNNSFNQDISTWDVSRVTDMSKMFSNATGFNGDISNWNVSNVTNMSEMFQGASSYNQPLGGWNVNSVTDMSKMFSNATGFNGDISNWNVSNVTNMSEMFQGTSSYNQPLGDWNVSKVTDMSKMFFNAFLFDQSIAEWDVSSVTDMDFMFGLAYAFNQPIGQWDVGNVTDMSAMFTYSTSFNQDISDWDVSQVTDMSSMFQGASSFNQPLESWDVSNVTDMFWMFHVASSFNQPLENWDVSNVTSMNGMFANASTFNQDCSGWSVSNVTDCGRFNDDSPISQEFIPNFTNCSI